MIRLFAALLFASAPMTFAAGPCPHRYFPIEQGLKLTYRAGQSEVNVSFDDVRAEAHTVSGRLALTYKDKRGQTEAVCGKDGIVTGFGGLEGTALQATGMDVKVVESEGVAFPPAAEMKVGKEWSNKLSLELRPPKEMKLPGGMSPVIRTQFSRVSTVIGREKVTVKAGTFDTLKVKNRTTAGTGTAGSERVVDSLMWLAPNVGIVKIATGESVDLELLSVDLRRIRGVRDSVRSERNEPGIPARPL